jgi:hypothetical protein
VASKTDTHYKSGQIDSDIIIWLPVIVFFQVGLNDSGEYRCGSDLTGEAVVRVNVVAGETEQELKSLHLDSDSISNGATTSRTILESKSTFLISTFLMICFFATKYMTSATTSTTTTTTTTATTKAKYSSPFTFETQNENRKSAEKVLTNKNE